MTMFKTKWFIIDIRKNKCKTKGKKNCCGILQWSFQTIYFEICCLTDSFNIFEDQKNLNKYE